MYTNAPRGIIPERGARGHSRSPLPAIERGLRSSGRTREDFDISSPVMVVCGADEAAFEASRDAVDGGQLERHRILHFATHGEFLLTVLHVVGLPKALDPAGIIYCPPLDSPYPFKFAVVGDSGKDNRLTYVRLLKQLLRQTESDEVFRERNFRELIRGVRKGIPPLPIELTG